ncbi:MAG TPA: hypothetical protein DCP63_09555 [Bacteroidetes bacterium]|nr:hypothetical protein [Bacteroidota bacterium]
MVCRLLQLTLLVFLPHHLWAQAGEADSAAHAVQPSIEALPILTYDTDVGFGYGAKVFFLNQLRQKESLDLVAFNSTKGERWYRIGFSVPDFEVRQGTVYSTAFDLAIDYDKFLKNNFYGVGNRSRKESREAYTKEPLEISGLVSRGFTTRFVGQLGLKYKTVRNFNLAGGGLLATTSPSLNQGRSYALTIIASIRYDSRDSYVNPHDGAVLQTELEVGRKSLGSDYNLASSIISAQIYRPVLFSDMVVALRWQSQIVGGDALPVHALATLGGSRTLRGYTQDRFLDRVMMLTNLELRFPLYWRFHGVGFVDAGKVWDRVRLVDLVRWEENVGIGLRYILDTFLVRADVGLGSEGVGFYLNFGQLF